VGGLTSQFDREMRRGIQRIEDTVPPYGRFVRAERQKLESYQHFSQNRKLILRGFDTNCNSPRQTPEPDCPIALVMNRINWIDACGDVVRV
jgi:hypothetical protein